MTRGAYRAMHAAAALAIATGLLYGWMRYGLRPDDPFAIVNHPWQAHVQHAHIVVTPLLAILLGAFWYAHAAVNWRGGTREGRRSGLALWGLALPMVLSGYLLQVSIAEGWRNTWLVTHLATALAWSLGYAGHWWTHGRR